jgi:integrase
MSSARRKSARPFSTKGNHHTFSVELLKAGVDIREVSKELGHSSVTITERYYAKWNKGPTRHSGRGLGARLEDEEGSLSRESRLAFPEST